MSTPTTHADLTIYQTDPLNAGTPLARLCQTFFTPGEAFFVRSHGSLPVVDRASYRLTINGMVQHPLQLSFEDLVTRFEQQTIAATLVCAGNRRSELAALRPLPGEVLWQADPISTASWRGVRLRDILHAAGIEQEARYVAFRGLDQAREEGQRVSFGSSIHLEKALAPEVLLVHEMNGVPLTPEHGFPVRVLIPGYVGARSVKWLEEITLQGQPSTNFFQDRDYKLFPPEVTAETVDWARGRPLEEIALNAVICTPQDGERREAGPTLIQGYALSGGEAPVERVELSFDQGATWIAAPIRERQDRWAWCLWEVTLNLPVGDCQLIVRAWDAAGKTQPEQMEPLWNFKGYANNAWHRVQLHLS